MGRRGEEEKEGQRFFNLCYVRLLLLLPCCITCRYLDPLPASALLCVGGMRFLPSACGLHLNCTSNCAPQLLGRISFRASHHPAAAAPMQEGRGRITMVQQLSHIMEIHSAVAQRPWVPVGPPFSPTSALVSALRVSSSSPAW